MLEKVVYQLNENIEYRIIGYQNILMQMAFDPRISAALTGNYNSLREEVEALQQINAVISRVRAYFPMRKIEFYKSNPSLHEDGGAILNLENAVSKDWYAAMEKENRQFYWHYEWSGKPQPSLHVSRWLVDYLTNEKFGIINLEVTSMALFDKLTNPLAFKNGWIVLADSEGRALIDFMDKKSGDHVLDLPYLHKTYEDEKGWYSTKINGKPSMVVFETNNLGWKIITVVSLEELWQKFQKIQNAAIIVGILFVVLTFVVMISFGGTITNRLNSLIRSMRKVQGGDLGLTVKVYGDDELAEVEEEFNKMSVQLEGMLREIAAARSAAETEKLRLLQAQINPHFLYNTLALVKSMAMDVGSAEISNTMDALAKFFRLALNRGIDVLTFKEELEHIQAYLDIHEQRYPGRVRVNFEIEEEALSCQIIKITLQPIIENALLHAFEDTGGRGEVFVQAAFRENMLHITIRDNGKGMSPGQLNDLMEGSSSARKDQAGFGLYNVNERLKRYYGESYSMRIKSAVGEGTSIQFIIPQYRNNNPSNRREDKEAKWSK
ncbi:sensor histidine kinase [Paenibacillus sp. GCM10027626]|uniref:sensor histidine kinase n=1 Tax=Paenibacillus sp. GCM10027626 TaxID=3273411 RepID=UPI00363171B6